MQRCELILTDKCNFKCPYCRGLREDCKGTLPLEEVKKVIDYWSVKGLNNIRFSGGEPTLYPELESVVSYAKNKGVKRIALSTNGSGKLDRYKSLISLGVNDLSISLDACCSSVGKEMCGISGAWETVVNNIRELSKLVYTTVGMVFVENTVKKAKDTIEFAHSLGVSDIRIVSSAQFNSVIQGLDNLDESLLSIYPILRYRVNNFRKGRNMRGIQDKDSHKCSLVLDDSVIAGNYHFPCIIYLREGGNPIGVVNSNMGKERLEWFNKHDTHIDGICRKNCLDVCIDYNNKYREFHGGE